MKGAEMTAATPTAEEPISPALKKLTWVLVLGALAPALDTTIVNVALAAIGKGLHTSVPTSQWTITGYLLAAGMAMPVTRWATECFGAKRVWLVSLGLFMIGSALSGASRDVASLIIFRLVQGAAAGLMLPIVTTLLVKAAGPRRLGRLMGMATLPLVVVPVFGPVVGGLVVNDLSWRWIFYVNVPICLVALVLAWRVVPPSQPQYDRQRLDVLGLGLLSPAVALVIYGLSKASGSGGFATAHTLVPLSVGAVLGCAFVVHSLRKTDGPIVNLRVFRVRSYAASVSVFLLAGLSLYGPLLLLGLYYQQVQGKSALVAGLLLAPLGIGSLLPRTVAGKLTDRIGPRVVVLTSLVLTALGTIAFTQAGAHTSEWLLAASLLVRGAGLAGATIAVMAGAFRGVQPNDVPDASTTTRIVQQVGGSFGAAVLAVILAHGLLTHGATVAARAAAFGTAFWWAIGVAVLALIPALFLPSTVKARSARAGTPVPSAQQEARV
jgi:EmrB/QacA subfamily drug resistance transporter